MTNLNLSLKANARLKTGKQVDELRKQGKIPAVLYGHKIEAKNLTLDYSAFEKIFKAAGESTLIDLKIDEQEPVKVLIQDYQLEPTINRFLHVDFHQVSMDEELKVEIELKFIGEAPAVKELNGVLVTSIDHLEAECLPKDLVHEIEVDLSGLKTFADAIHVTDIKLPPGIKVLNVPDDVVALVQEPRSEKELEELDKVPQAPVPAEAEGETDKENEGEKDEKEPEAGADKKDKK